MRHLIVAFVLAAAVPFPAWGIVNGTAPPDGDTRWDAVGSLNGYCSAVLVASDAVLTARHCLESNSYTITFRTGDAVDVASFYLPEGGDAAIGYLKEPIAAVEPIPVSFYGANEDSYIRLSGFGSGVLSTCSTWVTFAAPESYIQFPAADDPAGPGCGPEHGDSGGAVIVGARARRVVGVIAGTSDATNLARYAEDPNFQALVAP